MPRLLALLLLLTLPATAAVAAGFSSERIGVEVRGSGPDVVLIPGLSSSPEVWESTVAALPGYRFHLIHVAGFAGRPAGANAQGPVVAPVAEEIARYIREAGLERPALVGHSLGGFWSMMAAARHPGLVSRIMVVDMMPFMGTMFGGPSATPDSVRPIAEQIRQGIATAEGEARRAQGEQTIASMVRTESMRPAAVAHMLDSDPAVSGQAMYDLVTTDLRPELGAIDVPFTVLWVHPPGAPITPEQMTFFYRASYANVPGATVTQVPESYHFIMWDAPEAFQAALRDFLAG